jgi:hypothetical protein
VRRTSTSRQSSGAAAGRTGSRATAPHAIVKKANRFAHPPIFRPTIKGNNFDAIFDMRGANLTTATGPTSN